MKIEDHLAAVAQALLQIPIEGNRVHAIVDSMIDVALSISDGNISAAARLLGVHRKVIERWIAKRKTRKPCIKARSAT